VKFVLNTSPVIFLSKIKCLHLFVESVEEVVIPQGVFDELHDDNLQSQLELRKVSQIGSAYIRGAIGQLHQGELEAIVLAQELNADYVVLDDLLARQKAKRLGLNVIGTIGILLLLKKWQKLNANETWGKIMELTEQHNMYLSTRIFESLKGQLQ